LSRGQVSARAQAAGKIGQGMSFPSLSPAFAQTMARYNAWMNERLYSLCVNIPDEERKRDAGAFFKSIHGTLNHLLLGDRIWMGRFKGRPFRVESLAQELYADFAELRAERASTDAEIIAWVDSLPEKRFEGELAYT